MANSYLTSNLISKEIAALFNVFNSFLHTGRKNYEGMFTQPTYKPGDTVNIRQDNYFIGARGDVINPESIVEASFPLTVKPLFSVGIEYTPTDLTRKIADYSDEVLMPVTRRIVTMLNQAIVQDALTQINYWTGSSSANLNSYASIDAVNPIMDNLAMDSAYNRYLTLSPTQAQQLRSASSVQNAFTSPLNKNVTMDARLDRLAGFDIFKDQALMAFTAGTHATSGTITVTNGVASGTTILLGGLTAGTTFVPGDVISIANTYEYNPILRTRTNRNMQFVVQQTVTASGGGAATVTVFPEIIFTGPRKNISATAGDNDIPAGSVVTVVGDHAPNFAYTERGLITCMPPLDRIDCPDSSVATDRTTGISLRVSKTGEVLNNKNIMRVDCQMASGWVPGQAIRVISSV